MKQAQNLADSAIANFLAGVANYESASTIGSAIEDHFDVDSTGFVEEVLIKKIIDELRETSRSRAKINIIGLKSVYKWTLKHPNYGHQLVGIVRVWTPFFEKRARAIKSWKSERNKSMPETKTIEKNKSLKGKTEVIEGSTYMTPQDM